MTPDSSLLITLALTLEYQREAILQGEVWRLLTGHLVHLDPRHLLLNLLGLVLLLAIFRDHLPPVRLALLTMMLALSISAGLLLFSPDVAWYRGASGILYGLLTWSLLTTAARPKTHARYQRPIALAVIVLLTGATIYDYLTDDRALSQTGWPVITEAHLFGLIAAVIAFVVQAVVHTHLRSRRTHA